MTDDLLTKIEHAKYDLRRENFSTTSRGLTDIGVCSRFTALGGSFHLPERVYLVCRSLGQPEFPDVIPPGTPLCQEFANPGTHRLTEYVTESYGLEIDRMRQNIGQRRTRQPDREAVMLRSGSEEHHQSAPQRRPTDVACSNISQRQNVFRLQAELSTLSTISPGISEMGGLCELLEHCGVLLYAPPRQGRINRVIDALNGLIDGRPASADTSVQAHPVAPIGPTAPSDSRMAVRFILNTSTSS